MVVRAHRMVLQRVGGASLPDRGSAAYDQSVTIPTRAIDFRLELTEAELVELESALLKARASELSEVRRRDVRLTAGYGDATTREVLDDEGRRAGIRHEILSRLIDALRRGKVG